MSITDQGHQELRAVYERSYTRLVGLVSAVGGDSSEAEDIVQDAFVRAMSCWGVVSSYDSPEAWLRKVALGLLSNRRRTVRNGIKAVLRHGPPTDVPALNGDAVDLDRAMRLLPLRQREVLVLAYVAGRSLESISSDLSVLIGTVKSRLNRAKAALTPTLREEVNDHA